MDHIPQQVSLSHAIVSISVLLTPHAHFLLDQCPQTHLFLPEAAGFAAQKTSRSIRSVMSSPSVAPLSDPLVGSRTSTDEVSLYSSPTCIFFTICITILVLALNVCVFGAVFHNIRRMPSVDVSSAMVSPFTISYSSQHQLTAIWNLSMEFPNTFIKMDMTYQRIDASLFYGPHLLSQATIPPFHLQQLRTAMVNLTMVAHSEPIDGDASSGMVTDLALDGSIDFRLELQAWVIFDALHKGESLEVFRVCCDGVKIAFSLSADGVVGPGEFLHPHLKCRVLQGLFDKFD